MKKYDVLIIGAGPAGLTAGVYCSRAGLNVAMIEKGAPGGKIAITATIENWLGDEKIDGVKLALRMYNHAIKENVKHLFGEVNKVDFKNKIVYYNDKTIQYKFLIIATGTSEVIPEHIKNIYRFNQKGVSYCAICDGPLFKGEKVAVLGGGNSALEEALYLSTIVEKVYIIVRNKIKADKKIVINVENKKNIEIIFKNNIKEICGKEKLEYIILDDNAKLKVKALFPYIGLKANTNFLQESKIEMVNGFIKTKNTWLETNEKNVYAAGDVLSKEVRQISTASADGTIVAKHIIDNFK